MLSKRLLKLLLDVPAVSNGIEVRPDNAASLDALQRIQLRTCLLVALEGGGTTAGRGFRSINMASAHRRRLSISSFAACVFFLQRFSFLTLVPIFNLLCLTRRSTPLPLVAGRRAIKPPVAR